jgi:hypothetical protein
MKDGTGNMNVYEHLADLDETRQRIKGNQDVILDVFDKNNPDHIKILQETICLMNEVERLEKEYQNLLKEESL